MAEQIPIATTTEELAAHLSGDESYELGRDAGVICELGGGILKFAGAVYPGVSSEQIYASVNQREPEGRGAHFDVYGNYVHPQFPWVAVYNVSGRASVRTTLIGDELASAYDSLYPETNDAAYQARRHFADLAFGAANAKIYHGIMAPGSGLVLPQPADGPHIAHDVVPTLPRDPGAFVKLVMPNESREAADKMSEGGYATLDELVTKGLGNIAVVSEDLRIAPPRRQRRRCNLD